MKLKAGFVVAFVLCCAVTAFGQPAEIPLPPPATDTIAPNIPGVVKGGTKVQVIVDGLRFDTDPPFMCSGCSGTQALDTVPGYYDVYGLSAYAGITFQM